MYLSFKLLLLSALFLMMSCADKQVVVQKPGMEIKMPIIPKPLNVEADQGFFTLNKQTTILLEGYNSQLMPVAAYLADLISQQYGFTPAINSAANQSNLDNSILLSLDLKNTQQGDEGYVLKIGVNQIEITGNRPMGVFFGIQSLRQLLPMQADEQNLTLLCLVIADRPRYPWRGFMLDVSRHFFPKEFIIELIDYLAMHKLNTFHWHLCDDQGWRIEIKKYPKLAELAAWRVDREHLPWNSRPPQQSGEAATYGGYYTQDEIREIVAYAQSRFITVVPEIEMPGHTLAALAAYPQYSCSGGPFTVPPGSYWPISDVYCPGNDSTFIFLQDILTEVMALFPSKYIHIGGDEVEKSRWKVCRKCQTRIKAEGLANEEELQSYFIRRIEKFLNEHDRNLIGWDEILEGGLAPNATVMSWRGFVGGIAAARSGHDVVMSPVSHCYFNLYQGDAEQEPLAYEGYLPLKKVYEFEPTPEGLNSAEAKHVLGGQANLWAEFNPDPITAKYLIFPRIAALSEVLWTARELRNWADFDHRLPAYFNWLDKMQITHAKSVYQVILTSSFNHSSKFLRIELNSESDRPQIHYTLDGSDPSRQSPFYESPFRLTKSALLKAASFIDGIQASRIMQKELIIHKATGKKVSLTNLNSHRYNGGGESCLTNSITGSKRYNDGRWQGFEQVDFEALIDLENLNTLQSISCNFLEHTNAWIFLPTEVEYALSEDGNSFQVIFYQRLETPQNHRENSVKTVRANFRSASARFVRVRAKNLGVCPAWHYGVGGKTWLFIDEIVVE